MANKYIHKLKLAIASFIFAIYLAYGLPAQAGEAIKLGIISSKPAKVINQFSTFMDYLETKGLPAAPKIVVTQTIQDMIKKVINNEVNLIFESPFGALLLMDYTQIKPILIREKGGVKNYNSVIFVRKDSPITSFKDLVGKLIAFEDPTSSSSFLAPFNLLQAKGFVVEKSKSPSPGVISYYFSGNDNNSILHVKKRPEVAAGGINKNKIENNPLFRMLTPETAMVPRNVVLAKSSVQTEKLSKILLAMSSDADAQTLLDEMDTPTGFSQFNGDPSSIMNSTVRMALYPTSFGITN